MAQVLLTHSYHLPYDPKQLRKMQPYMPIGTLYAATALRENGISVVVFDSMLEEPSTMLEKMLVKHQPKIVAVYEDDFNFLSKMCLTRMRERGVEDRESSAVGGRDHGCAWFRFDRQCFAVPAKRLRLCAVRGG